MKKIHQACLALTIGASALLGTVGEVQANVRPQEELSQIEQKVEETFTDVTIEGLLLAALEFLGLDLLLADVVGLLEELNQSTENIVEIRVPDLEVVTDIIYEEDSSAHNVASILLSRSSGSFSVRQNEINEATRDTIRNNLTLTKTSEEARRQSKELTTRVTDAAETIAEIGAESQELDVSQQLLQNLALQTSLQGQINATVANQIIEGELNRASEIQLALQTAQYVEEITNYIRTIENRRGVSNAASWVGVSSPIHTYQGEGAVRDRLETITRLGGG